MPEMEDLLSAAADEADGEPVELELEEISLSDIEPGELEGESDELLLDEIAPLEVDEDGDHDLELDSQTDLDDDFDVAIAGSAGAAFTEPTEQGEAPTQQAGEAFAGAPLSKFRRPEGDAEGATEADAEADADAGGSALGRVKIVRMKQSKDGRAPARARVLASY